MISRRRYLVAMCERTRWRRRGTVKTDEMSSTSVLLLLYSLSMCGVISQPSFAGIIFGLYNIPPRSANGEELTAWE